MIKITADSTCDLSPEILESMNITLIPLHILVGSDDFRDGIDISPADVFRYVDKEGKLCKTAAVNVYEYEKLFGEFSEQYDAVIHICISSEFSSCYKNALIAAENFKNVYVIDSRNLSSGQGHIVYDAALMARSSADPEEICRQLELLIPKVDASFVIDRLDYLHKGGRCSDLAAIGSRIFMLKPCIEVVNGKMEVGKKYRGGFKICLQRYVKDRLENAQDIDYSRVFITHPMCSPHVVEEVKETIRRYADFQEIIETRAGCTVSGHCGPNTLGILFKRLSPKKQ